MPLKLYEITDELKACYDLIAMDDGEITPEIELLLRDAQIDFNSKVENVARMTVSMKAEVEAFKVESDRLAKKAKTIGNKIEWLKNYLKTEMTAAKIKKVEGDFLTVSIRPSNPSVIILDDKAIPEDFKHEVREWQIDKKAIIDHYKANGEIVAGTEIAVGETLTIR